VRPGALRKLLERNEKTLRRAFGSPVRAPSAEEATSIVETTCERIEARMLEILGLARRAGCLEIGLAAVEDALGRPAAGTVVLLAEDAEPRVDLAVRQAATGNAEVHLVLGPSRAKVGAALGQREIGVAAVRHRMFSKALVREFERLEGLKASEPRRRYGD
jgi:ribosomal protein L7Ae-like RNA K-turn-binding protein